MPPPCIVQCNEVGISLINPLLTPARSQGYSRVIDHTLHGGLQITPLIYVDIIMHYKYRTQTLAHEPSEQSAGTHYAMNLYPEQMPEYSLLCLY